MKYKKFLLVTFFLTLFVFQQVQAGATIPPTENLSQVSFAPAYAPSDTIYVFVLALTSGNTIDYSINGDQPYKCLYAYQYTGCGIIDPESPTAPRNPVPVTVDPYYLRDVITIEMNVGEIPPTEPELPALKAQAIAARSVASWKYGNAPFLNDNGEFFEGVRGINNSTQYQVFIPGSYDNFPAAQDLIDRAITETQGEFLSYEPEGTNPVDGTRKTIDAEFSSDIIPESKYGNQGYLQKIQEPISSSTCNVQGTVGNDWGMSQRGAIRWAIGNTCPDESGTDWPVQWTDYRQILVHYYTGIDILNSSGNKVTPDDRWNLIAHTLPLDPNRVATANAGGSLSFNITVQNTSAVNFNWSDVVIGYKWNNGNWTVLPNNVSATSLVNPLDTSLENPSVDFPLSIPVPTDLPANSILHLDLGHLNSQTVNWFSAQSPAWPDAQILVQVTGSIGCTHWDIASDFRISPNHINPNPDSCGNASVWEFMGSGTPNYQLPTFDDAIGGYTGLDFWLGTYVDGNGSFPAIGFNGSGETRVFGAITFPVNAVNIHPAPVQSGVISWHSPVSGHVSISGGVSDNDPACGNGIVWYLDKNTIDLASGGIVNGGSQSFANGSGGTELGTVEVNIGDTIYLAIHSNGDYFCDNTKVDFIVDVTNAPPTATPLGGPTSTSFPPNYTPPPSTETPFPTPTPPTIQPTSSPYVQCYCVIDFLVYLEIELPCWLLGSNNLKLAAPLPVFQSTQQAILDVQLFHRVEDEILSQTPQGEEYIALYYEYSPEIIQILHNDPSLKQEAIEVLQMWEPNLQALVDGEGNTVTISNAQVLAVQTFLNNLSSQASPELQQVIANEQIQQPLEQFSGVTMAEALVYVEDGLSETPTPTQTPTFTPSPTLSPTITPTITSTTTPTSTVTPAPITVSLQPNGANGIDTYILSSSSNANYGISADMGIGENINVTNKFARSLLKFDVSSIPPNAIITSATLSIWTSNDFAINPGTIEIYRLKVPFIESQATWNRSATGVNWQIAGASGANDRENIAIGSVQIVENTSLNIEKQVILNPTRVQEWINGVFTNNGMILVMSSELDNRFDFKTSDTSTTTQRPKLVVTYILQP